MSGWNFIDLVEEAGYYSSCCTVDDDNGDFLYILYWQGDDGEMGLCVRFNPFELEMLKPFMRGAAVKLELDKAHEKHLNRMR